jgi:hypothetical protein
MFSQASLGDSTSRVLAMYRFGYLVKALTAPDIGEKHHILASETSRVRLCF